MLATSFGWPFDPRHPRLICAFRRVLSMRQLIAHSGTDALGNSWTRRGASKSPITSSLFLLQIPKYQPSCLFSCLTSSAKYNIGVLPSAASPQEFLGIPHAEAIVEWPWIGNNTDRAFVLQRSIETLTLITFSRIHGIRWGTYPSSSY